MTTPRDRTELRELLAAASVPVDGVEDFQICVGHDLADALLSALDAAGLVIVPREATQGMRDAGWRMFGPDDTPEITYTKMLSASPFSVTEDPQP